MTFSSTGVGFLSHTPENNVKIISLISNLVHIINGIRLLRMQNFRKFAPTISLILKIDGNWSKIGC